MSDLKDMDLAVYQRLTSHVEKLLEEWEEAVHEGTVSGDEKSPFVKLARERFEIEQQIADLQATKIAEEQRVCKRLFRRDMQEGAPSLDGWCPYWSSDSGG
jgi:hypothetical protein